MMTTNLKVKGDWTEVMNDCRNTVSKEALDNAPTSRFVKRMLIAEHSPIRDISIRWKWEGIKSWIATHFSRHKWECYISTQRSDRTGIPRDELPQGAPVNFVGEANIQQLIDTMRKRLCWQASTETRQYAENLKVTIARHPEPEIAAIAEVLVPNCVYRCGCPEMECCGVWKIFVDFCKENAGKHPGEMTIRQRYIWYDDFFFTNYEERMKNSDVQSTPTEGH